MTLQIDWELLTGNDDYCRRERSSADGPYYAGPLYGSNFDMVFK